jgi:uncharacterized protein (TIGR02145 family)
MKKLRIFYLLLLIFIGASCKQNPTLPGVTTFNVTDITQTTATTEGIVLSDGGATVTAKGICWNTTENPTIEDTHTNEGTGTGGITGSMTGLSAGVTYHVRAYATNIVGIAYGTQRNFTTIAIIDSTVLNPDKTYGSVTDVEGNTYKTIQIGTQTWMAENLKAIKYNDGNQISNVTSWSSWEKLITGAYCWYSNDESSYKADYGALYNWYAVSSGKLCPAGWHVPELSEWFTLVDYLGGESVAGGKLKEIGTTHWTSPNEGATNETGFTALPGGVFRGSIYDDTGLHFGEIGSYGVWWSRTIDRTATIGSLSLRYHTTNIFLLGYYSTLTRGNSVRCLKN